MCTVREKAKRPLLKAAGGAGRKRAGVFLQRLRKIKTTVEGDLSRDLRS
jgi:hypothetical protein